MLTAVLDANILVRGIARRPGTLVSYLAQSWQEGRFTLVLSEHVLQMLDAAIRQPHFQARLSDDMVATYLTFVRSTARIVPITATVQGVAPDWDDDQVLATALSAGAGGRW